MAITDIDILAQRNLQLELADAEEKNAALEERVKKLERPNNVAKASTTPLHIDGDIPFMNQGKNYIMGYFNPDNKKRSYHDTIKLGRWFYENDPIAGTVITRMADMSITTVRNRKVTKLNADKIDDATLAFYDALVEELRPFLKIAALEFLINGMAVPSYTTIKLRGDKISEKLGRKRYTTVDKIWVRNPDNIVLKRRVVGMDRQVFIKIPQDDITFIQNKGIRSDGTVDKETYNFLVENYPEYVVAVNNGKTLLELADVTPIYRKLTSYEVYPTPFLQNALKALQHKEYLKAMDRSIASRAIEAIRHIKVGDKDYPADQDDIDTAESLLNANASNGERVFNLFTNHTYVIEWIMPPLEALLNEAKYVEPNNDIFLGLGFPRILTVGETAKSNAADNKIASIGPKATLDDMRELIIYWLKKLYRELADINGFTRIPEPYFSPIATSDMTALTQFAVDAMTNGAISKDTVAQLYGTDFNTESIEIVAEQESGVLSPAEHQKQKDQEFQVQQSDVAHQRSMETMQQQAKLAPKASKNGNTN
jgi:hypothetical protein